MATAAALPDRGHDCFYTLPAEVRHEILKHALIAAEPVVVWFSNEHSIGLGDNSTLTVIDHSRTKDSLSGLAIGLLFCDRIIAPQAAAIFYGHNTFAFEGLQDLGPVVSWTQCIGSVNRAHISLISLMPSIPSTNESRRELPRLPGHHLHKHSKDNPGFKKLPHLFPTYQESGIDCNEDINILIGLLRRPPGTPGIVLHAYLVQPYIAEALATPAIPFDESPDPMRRPALRSVPPRTQMNTADARWQVHRGAGFVGSGITVAWEVTLLPEMDGDGEFGEAPEEEIDDLKRAFTDKGWKIIREKSKTFATTNRDGDDDCSEEASNSNDDNDGDSGDAVGIADGPSDDMSDSFLRATVAIGDIRQNLLQMLPPSTDSDDQRALSAGNMVLCGSCTCCREWLAREMSGRGDSTRA
ncbi:hypothetical protein KVT40_004690 [Elsinoe batatas]|uniref:Uncharacterized protein n=1 Tax=Elsinoe batatas TaxID=2601811 RepID=A0A8K0L176_9PEZI|nr:hypothetical protein KVT40_004690 [Elsinoe batatas]